VFESADPAIRFAVRLVALLRRAWEAIEATPLCVRIEFFATELRPIEDRGAQLDGGGVDRQQLVLETELVVHT